MKKTGLISGIAVTQFGDEIRTTSAGLDIIGNAHDVKTGMMLFDRLDDRK